MRLGTASVWDFSNRFDSLPTVILKGKKKKKERNINIKSIKRWSSDGSQEELVNGKSSPSKVLQNVFSILVSDLRRRIKSLLAAFLKCDDCLWVGQRDSTERLEFWGKLDQDESSHSIWMQTFIFRTKKWGSAYPNSFQNPKGADKKDKETPFTGVRIDRTRGNGLKLTVWI